MSKLTLEELSRPIPEKPHALVEMLEFLDMAIPKSFALKVARP
jgi:hypothetical protein